jgi:hypothetical protein
MSVIGAKADMPLIAPIGDSVTSQRADLRWTFRQSIISLMDQAELKR